jgi:hypothetical protein
MNMINASMNKTNEKTSANKRFPCSLTLKDSQAAPASLSKELSKVRRPRELGTLGVICS